tara:strand:- start:346 stop:1059 length:714 start_codon:yes stop_codon:yes gene_type:complete
MPTWSKMKRFYEHAGVMEQDGVYLVVLDGRVVKTPAGSNLGSPTRALTKAMSEEWEKQSLEVNPETMSLCKLAATAIDRLNKKRDEVIGITLKIAETDLLCYRVSEPEDLVALQNRGWDPELEWAIDELDVMLKVTVGLIPVNQPEKSLLNLRNKLMSLTDFQLMGVTNAASVAGSLILALSMFYRRIDAQAMFEKSILEEKYQVERWGKDNEAMIKQEVLREDIKNSSRFLNLLSA